MRIQFNLHTHFNKINFKGNRSVEPTSQNYLGVFVHDTCFFREPETDKLVKDYLLKNFTNDPKIKIVNGACSTGEETYTQAMLYSDLKDRMEISGFDISQNAIEQAKKGIFSIYERENNPIIRSFSPAYHDSYLTDSFRCLNREEAEQKKLFDKFFKPIPPQIPIIPNKHYFQANDEIKGLCNFRVGDIKKLSENYDKNSLHALTCKNALYHLLCIQGSSLRRSLLSDADNIATDIAKQAHEIIRPKGLFVLGQNEASQGVDNKMIYRVMTENGFEPGKELSKSDRREKRCNIWKKV